MMTLGKITDEEIGRRFLQTLAEAPDPHERNHVGEDGILSGAWDLPDFAWAIRAVVKPLLQDALDETDVDALVTKQHANHLWRDLMVGLGDPDLSPLYPEAPHV